MNSITLKLLEASHFKWKINGSGHRSGWEVLLDFMFTSEQHASNMRKGMLTSCREGANSIHKKFQLKMLGANKTVHTAWNV